MEPLTSAVIALCALNGVTLLSNWALATFLLHRIGSDEQRSNH